MGQMNFGMTQEALAADLMAMSGRRVVVLGDVMLDAYLNGSVERISPEAPVPVLEVEREVYQLGGAANVAHCLAALGAQVTLCGVIGEDDHAARFCSAMHHAGLTTDGLVVDPSRPTTTKTRIVSGCQQLVRIDHERRHPLIDQPARQLQQKLQWMLSDADAVVLSDYSKGTLTDTICRQAISVAQQIPIVVDPKQLPWERFAGATVLKPNRREAEAYVRWQLADSQLAGQAARQIAREVGVKYALITRGAEGMTWSRADGEMALDSLPAQRRELVDVTGAGDIVAATLALALAAGRDMRRAAELANRIAGIKVGKFGSATVTAAECLADAHTGPSSAHKILSREQARNLAAELHHRGQHLVFTNGCFDLLHLGHVTYLERSRELGDFLLVGLNSDDSVRRLKGPTRPVQSEHDRARILAAQASVDGVVVFDEDTPLDLILALRPHVLTKGADYQSVSQVVGAEQVLGWGGRVELIDLVEGRSTTRMIQRAA
jgi:D-beta-D-heptose 7-phosphate kinase/D-beta-D-heptose 1-phosphate adenosyltransferase